MHCHFVDCCHGGRQGNTERLVTRQHPVASNVALDMLHWVMPLALLQHLCMTIEMTCDGGTFACLHRYVAKGMVQAWVAQKTLKLDILRVFIMSDYKYLWRQWLMICNTKRLL